MSAVNDLGFSIVPLLKGYKNTCSFDITLIEGDIHDSNARCTEPSYIF